MTVRSIIDIEVADQQFQKFTQLFDKYSETLRKQPALWKQISNEHSKLASGFAKLGNQMDEHFGAVDELKDLQDEQEASLTHSAALWGDIEKSSKGTAKNVIGMTTSLLKWTGLLSGAAGLLGYFSLGGIEDLGRDVYGWRKNAMGLGLTTGQQRAFDIALGPLLGSPEGFLGGINTAVTDLSSPGRIGFASLGVNPNGSTAQVAVRTLEAVRALALRTPLNQLGIAERNYHLGDLGIGVEDFRRIKSMSGGDFNSYIGDIGKWQGSLNLSDQTTRAWTKFMMGMDAAGTKIENTFVKGLQPLAGPIANLTSGFTSLLQVVMAKNGPIAKDIDAIAGWMKSFNGEITKPKFISGLERFVDIFSIIGDIPGVGHDTPPKKGARGFWATLFGGPAPGSFWSPGSYWRDEMDWALGMRGRPSQWTKMTNQMDPSGLLALVGNLESGMNPYAMDSSKGAMGMLQIMPDVARAAGINPYDPEQALSYANAELHRLVKDYHGDFEKTLAAYNFGEGNVNRKIKQYGSAWEQHLPKETMDYLAKAIALALGGAIKVQIVNATGGSASASVSALGAQK